MEEVYNINDLSFEEFLTIVSGCNFGSRNIIFGLYTSLREMYALSFDEVWHGDFLLEDLRKSFLPLKISRLLCMAGLFDESLAVYKGNEEAIEQALFGDAMQDFIEDKENIITGIVCFDIESGICLVERLTVAKY